MDIGAILSAIVPRALGIAAAWLTQKAAEKTGVIVDPASLTAAGLVAYAAIHRAVSSKLNPGDAASRRMVNADKNAVASGTPVTPVTK
jgi:hypothetical protein